MQPVTVRGSRRRHAHQSRVLSHQQMLALPPDEQAQLRAAADEQRRQRLTRQREAILRDKQQRERPWLNVSLADL